MNRLSAYLFLAHGRPIILAAGAAAALLFAGASFTSAGAQEADELRGLQNLGLGANALAAPSFPTTDPESRVITVREIYFYDEALFTPPVRIFALPDGVADQSSPERTMFSRISAIYDRDYDKFFQYWDEASRGVVEAEFASGAYTREDLVGNWGVLNNLDIVLKRKILAGDYNILIYEFMGKGSDEGPGFEMPVIFRKIDGLWYATQDLRRDELIASSTWASGDNEVEFTVR